ncbi:uncharacterized protein BKCO1_3000242 [Diplodia corticola]|uniref:Uncharacterized protein n=1 Tax=Diplodia corticola TaxID=236234 RepID=A0A1J9RB84_9PEZI|nr:uncharacterized protein BKCO1_3000242 [Diplodia corticola]OJD38862.1 hypothetical protein BKCO1_3000242 [Diplodia corticola]
MSSDAIPLNFACEADEKAYATLVEEFMDNARHLAVPGFSFAEPGAHAFPVGVFPALLKLFEISPSYKAFRAAKLLVADAGIARVSQTGAKDKVVHREDILQAIVQVITGDKHFFGKPQESGCAKPHSLVKIHQQLAVTSANMTKTMEEPAVTVEITSSHVDDLELDHLAVAVKGSRLDATLASVVEREIRRMRDDCRDKIRQSNDERDHVLSIQAITASMVHDLDREKKASDDLIYDLQQERNECWDIIKAQRKLLRDTVKRLEDMAKQLGETEKHCACWRDVANNMKRQRDDWQDRAGTMKAERDEWQEYASDVKAQRDCLRTKASLRRSVQDCNHRLDLFAKEARDRRKTANGASVRFASAPASLTDGHVSNHRGALTSRSW